MLKTHCREQAYTKSHRLSSFRKKRYSSIGGAGNVGTSRNSASKSSARMIAKHVSISSAVIAESF